MTFGRFAVSTILAAVLFVFAAGPPAFAAIEDDTQLFEVYVGAYDPGPSEIDSSTVFGFRYGANYNDRAGLFGELSYTSMDGDDSVLPPGDSLKVDVLFLDLIADYNFLSQSRAPISIYGGIGGAFTSTSGTVSTPGGPINLNNLSQSSFTLLAGASIKIQLSEKIYLRPAIQTHWFEARNRDEFDTEFLVGLGWNFDL